MIASICDIPLAVAVSVAVSDLLTAVADTLKPVLVAPVCTVTEVGACSALLLLESFTTVSLAAAALIYTEHAFVVGPVKVCVPHEILLKVGAGVGVGVGVGAATGYSVITSDFVTPPACPIIVTLNDWLTASVTALNPAVFAPAATTTVVGTFSAALLLVSEIFVGSVAGVVKFTEQSIDCAPVKDCVPHEIMLSAAADVLSVPVRLDLELTPHPVSTVTRHPASNTKVALRTPLFVERNERGMELTDSKEQ